MLRLFLPKPKMGLLWNNKWLPWLSFLPIFPRLLTKSMRIHRTILHTYTGDVLLFLFIWAKLPNICLLLLIPLCVGHPEQFPVSRPIVHWIFCLLIERYFIAFRRRKHNEPLQLSKLCSLLLVQGSAFIGSKLSSKVTDEVDYTLGTHRNVLNQKGKFFYHLRQDNSTLLSVNRLHHQVNQFGIGITSSNNFYSFN